MLRFPTYLYPLLFTRVLSFGILFLPPPPWPRTNWTGHGRSLRSIEDMIPRSWTDPNRSLSIFFLFRPAGVIRQSQSGPLSSLLLVFFSLLMLFFPTTSLTPCRYGSVKDFIDPMFFPSPFFREKGAESLSPHWPIATGLVSLPLLDISGSPLLCLPRDVFKLVSKIRPWSK